MPFPILQNLNAEQIARFEENFTGGLGADLDLQSSAHYPPARRRRICSAICGRTTVRRKARKPFFNYRLPDYRGVAGIEGRFRRRIARPRGRRNPCWSTTWATASPKISWIQPRTRPKCRADARPRFPARGGSRSLRASRARRARGGGGHGCAQRRRAGDGFVADVRPE